MYVYVNSLYACVCIHTYGRMYMRVFVRTVLSVYVQSHSDLLTKFDCTVVEHMRTPMHQDANHCV